jgi:hypothetical protein
LVLVNEGPFRKAAQPEGLEQADSIAGQARSISPSTQGRLGISALEGPSGQASKARTARLGERTNHVIADADVPDIWTDGSHDARDFVTEHRR